MKRSRIPRGKSKREFSRSASMTNGRNMQAPRKMPMRGGIRL